MKFTSIISVLLMIQLCSSCQERQTKKIESQQQSSDDGIDESIGELPPPPDAVLKTPVFTLDQWFARISQQKKENLVVKYRFSIYENEKFFAVYFKDDNDSTIKKDNAVNFSLLSKDEYKGMVTFPNVSKKIGKQLQALASTSQFKSSPLGKAKSISITFDDESKIILK